MRRGHPALAASRPLAYWLDDPSRPHPEPSLRGGTSADLAVVGGGYAGLWAALRAKERDPGLDVVLVEAGSCGEQASGRNGGFCSSSLTHGFGNGQERWPGELEALDRLGAENLDGIEASVHRYAVDCGFERTGELTVATAPHQVAELAAEAAARAAAGHRVELLDADAVRARVASPTYLAGLLDADGTALVEPARLAWGLRGACLELGVRIHEGTPATGLEARRRGGPVRLTTPAGHVDAERVLLATNAFTPLLRRLRLLTVPVYDFALMTEPLTAEQRASLAWQGREGVGDAGNLFHYYRLTREGDDVRMLWGGYDAVYHYRSRVAPALEEGPTHDVLAAHFAATFPQLAEVRFSHRWAGVIDTCTRFAAFYGTAYAGRVGYASGYTGLGVAATRFAADVVLDLLGGADTERTRLGLVRERPLPFPPEPARWAGIGLTRRSLAASDRRGGRRNLWLRGLERAGLGFDS